MTGRSMFLKILMMVNQHWCVLLHPVVKHGCLFILGLQGKKVLFVVPTHALVYQVSALFVKFGASVSIITSDFTYSNSNDNVFVGTRQRILKINFRWDLCLILLFTTKSIIYRAIFLEIITRDLLKL